MAEREVGIEEYKKTDVLVARIVNQREWEENHEVTFGMNFLDRASQVRNQIYKGYSKLAGYAPDEIRHQSVNGTWQTNRGHIKVEFTHRHFVKEYTEKYAKLMDEIYQEIKVRGDGKPEVVNRFVALINSIGISIHPYFDGNGQTLRLLTLSYMHELVPESRDLSFPYRFNKSDLFTFDMNMRIPDGDLTNEEIGKAMTEMLDERVTFFLSSEGQTLLKHYVFGDNPDKIGEIISASDPKLDILKVLRSNDELCVDIKENLKNWIVRKYSYYMAIQEKNQVR